MNTSDHIEELRRRVFYALFGLIISVVLGLFFCSHIIDIVKQPYSDIMISVGLEPSLQTLAPTDGFTAYLRIALLVGLTISSPWTFYQFWKFIAAGLYKQEKRYVSLAAPTSAILFVFGATFFIYSVAGPSLRFFILFNKRFLGVDSMFTFQSYMSYMTNLALVFGIAFQTPLAIFFLVQLGVVSLNTLYKFRKYVLPGVFVIAAIVTPPDVISQIALAGPLYLLYELGLLLSRCVGKSKEEQNITHDDKDRKINKTG